MRDGGLEFIGQATYVYNLSLSLSKKGVPASYYDIILFRFVLRTSGGWKASNKRRSSIDAMRLQCWLGKRYMYTQ